MAEEQTLPDIKIPEKWQPGLTKLQELSEDEAASLFNAIQSSLHHVRYEQATAVEISQLVGMPLPNAEAILGTLTFLYRVRANALVNAEVTSEQFINDICKSMRPTDRGESRSPEAISRFSDRLTKFLSIESLALAAKATVLRLDHEHPLCQVRILTDARPIFGPDVSKSPEAAVIFHLLKVSYHDQQRIREIFFALDETDLQQLKNALSRAESKADSLKKLLEAAGAKVIGAE